MPAMGDVSGCLSLGQNGRTCIVAFHLSSVTTRAKRLHKHHCTSLAKRQLRANDGHARQAVKVSART